MQPQPNATDSSPETVKPPIPATEAEEELYSVDWEIEKVKQKLEKQQEDARLKLMALWRRRRVVEKAIAQDREHGAGWTPMNGRLVNTGTGEIRPADLASPEARP